MRSHPSVGRMPVRAAAAALGLAVGLGNGPAAGDKWVFDGHICQVDADAQDTPWFGVDTEDSDTSGSGGGIWIGDAVEAVCALPTTDDVQTNDLDEIRLYFRMEDTTSGGDGEVVETALVLHDSVDGDFDSCMTSNHTVAYTGGVDSWTTTLYRATDPGNCDDGAATNEWVPAVRIYSGDVHLTWEALWVRGIRAI